MSGKRVLLIDADPQGDLTASLGWRNPDELETTLATHLEAVARDEPLEPDAGILKHPEGVDLMPANIELSGTEVALVTALYIILVAKSGLGKETVQNLLVFEASD